MIEMICIVCPKGCGLMVDENDNYKVSGHSCERGVEYGRDESMNPVRTVTSTVSITGAIYKRCPVKTAMPIPKKLIMDAMMLLDGACLTGPVQEGTVVVGDICGTGIPWVTTRAM